MSKKTPGGEPISVAFVSLGCAKNLVDLQVMGGELHLAGLEIGVEPENADAVLVNTCAFIEDARDEAISAILDACDLKLSGRCKAVIVTGCLAQRYRERIFRACPGVDAILGVDDLERIPDVVRRAVALSGDDKRIVEVSTDRPVRLFNPGIPGLVLTGGPYAYLKVAEGCAHACAFCAIPGIRGRLRSRGVPELVAEARALLSEGVSELNIIAQDVTSYGRDFGDGTNLVSLLRELDALDGDFWIRLLYGHPAMLSDELLEFIAASRHVCRYLDVPIQHSHPDVLRAMRRADTVTAVPEMAARIRRIIPGVALRTTCLVGFPGETEEHFRHLMDFIAAAKFENLGAFAFSPEEGTPAFDMGEEPDDVVAERRRRDLMKAQAKIALKILRGRIGEDVRILLEEPPEDAGGQWEGRAEWQAPDDIDGMAYVGGVPEDAAPGDFITAKLVDVDAADGFDVICEYVSRG